MVNAEIIDTLTKQFPAVVFSESQQLVLTVPKELYHDVCVYLKQQAGFEYLSCLTAVDWLKESRMDLVVHLENMTTRTFLQITVPIARDTLSVDSITDLWLGAKYLERETFDMFGIVFAGHKDLKRILSPDEETTHPLRKDFTIADNDTYGAACMQHVLHSSEGNM